MREQVETTIPDDNRHQVLSNIRRPRHCSALQRIEVSTMGIARIGGTSVLAVAGVSKKNAPAEAIFLFELVPRPDTERQHVPLAGHRPTVRRPATLDCATQGEWEAGSRTPLCDRSRKTHQGHGLENGTRTEPKDSRKATCPADRRDLPDRPERRSKPNRTQG